MRIAHNMMAWNAQNNLKTITGKRTKTTEKLASGYRINRAADDAAGLAISEKMRRLIRGLDQGSENAEDGISWSQSGDGALNEAHAILHRMTELTVKSLNGTNTESDRLALEYEFEQLQSELDRISTTTTFNELNIFEQHEVPYYQCEGDVKWDPHQIHVVTDGMNDLTFTYRKSESDQPETVTFNVPAGEYTTQELVDEIDDLMTEWNKTSDVELVLEFDQDGYCHANLEGGEVLDCVSGNMSYLLYQMFRGGGYGALIGTTSFLDEDAELEIVAGENDYMKFTIQNLQGPTEEKVITIPEGWYTRQELIDYLNQQLDDTTVRANVYGSGIRLASEDAIVTGFKGNMFKIDGNGVMNHSVFYDNVKYGQVTQTSAEFVGGYVLSTDSRDVEHKYYEIDSSNNQLTLQPSGFSAPITLIIDDGTYTASDMVNKLNSLFTQNNITTLKAEKIRNSKGFEGIRIYATDQGPESQIRLDAASSAYDTLFRIKEYNDYSIKVSPVNETKANQDAYFQGSKNFNQAGNIPLTITAGDNDQFKVTIDGDTYTLTLTAATYQNADAIRAEIDNQLNGSAAPAAAKGKVTVTVVDGKIRLTGTAGQNVNKITVSPVDANSGYKDIFQGIEIETITQTESGKGSVTLNTPYDPSIGIDPADTQMNIQIDGVDYNVTLPSGNPTTDEIKAAIEAAIPGGSVETLNTFTAVTATGSSDDRNFSSYGEGETRVTEWTDSARGTYTGIEGQVGSGVSEAAVLKIGAALNDAMVVGDHNNEITLTIKDITKVITLDNGTYTKAQLRDALQQKIDEAFGTGKGSASVALDGNYLVLTSRLQQGENGRSNYLECGTADSSFLRELNTTRTAAVCTSKYALNSSITITEDNRDFVFQFTENGTTKDITVSLEKGVTYTRSTLVAAINAGLRDQGVAVSATLYNNQYLRLTSTNKGDGIKIAYDTQNGGSSAEVMFGPFTVEEPAKIIADCEIQQPITIQQGVDDVFNIVVNGNNQTVTLDAGTYNDRQQFVEMLNQKLNGLGVKVTLDGNRLAYETIDKGSGVSLSMGYNSGGSSMKPIYGVSIRYLPSIQADFDADNKLTLSTLGSPNSQIQVNSNSGGPFMESQTNEKTIAVTSQTGYHSTTKSYIDGVSLNGDVTIDEWNNTLKFNYKDNGVSGSYSLEVPDGTYDFASLQTTLQNLVDTSVGGSGKITVTVTSEGVRLEAVNPGSNYTMTNFSGDFYDKVIGLATERREYVGVSAKEGTQVIDSAFTVGRKDVKNVTTKIQGGITDELNLDLTYGNNVYTLSMKLDAGNYSGEQLKQHLQDKINEQLAALGLPENLVEVGIGGINTGVSGANDDCALNFSLSKTVQAPSEGHFILDGVSGSAAFEIFYQTDGSLEQAYIVGTKDVSQGVTILPGQNEMSILVDGQNYDLTLTEGDYTAEELAAEINLQLRVEDVPVNAEIVDGKVKLIHRKMGPHEIRDVSGSAATDIFFRENGQITPRPERYVKLSSSTENSDRISLDNPIFNTNFMKINSICISGEKYAKKALDRLNDALEYISNIRSNFGSTQNRLEHAVNNNRNTAENLQAAESEIRDADMAKEMVALSGHNIVQQAGQAMLAQANQLQEGVLALLR